MTSGAELTNPPVAVVFGGHSPIAISCVHHLAHHQNVVIVTRKIDSGLEEAFGATPTVSLVEANLEERGAAVGVIESAFTDYQRINALVFLQRYRPRGENCFQSHCAVELWSIKEALDTLRSRKKYCDTVQVWISSSPAAQKAVLDQDLYYHMVKASQEALVRYYAALLGKEHISVNAIRVGSIILKERAMGYWNSFPKLLEGLENIAPIGSLLTSDDLGMLFALLASSSIPTLSGQILTIDNGFSLRDSAQIARSLIEQQCDH